MQELPRQIFKNYIHYLLLLFFFLSVSAGMHFLLNYFGSYIMGSEVNLI